MQFTNKNILELTEGLTALLQDSVALPALVSFAAVRNFKTLQPIAEDINKARISILQKYSDKVDTAEEAIYYTFPDDAVPIVQKELDDLLNAMTDLPLVTFTIDKLSGYDIPLKTMNILYFMVADGEA